jgi:UDP-glucuronate 4-epimerase
MNALVTGCAGFIGSALSLRLLQEGHKVIGVDCLFDNYDLRIKENRLASLLNYNNFHFIREHILELNAPVLIREVDFVFHQAALPGVRSSWGEQFSDYTTNNILATQKLLEAAKNSDIKKFVYASSSSVYGMTTGPTSEKTIPQPLSPYGVTKLAGEQLCSLYAKNFGVPTVSLRYFTVYGPGQRPDMAFAKFIRCLLEGRPISIYGDGYQTRDFTFIEDIVAANLLSTQYPLHGEVFNIGGGSSVILRDVLDLMAGLTGLTPHVDWIDAQAGDPLHTWANIDNAKRKLGYHPHISIEEGLSRQIAVMKQQM